MNLKMIQLKNQTEDLSSSFTKNCETRIEPLKKLIQNLKKHLNLK